MLAKAYGSSTLCTRWYVLQPLSSAVGGTKPSPVMIEPAEDHKVKLRPPADSGEPRATFMDDAGICTASEPQDRVEPNAVRPDRRAASRAAAWSAVSERADELVQTERLKSDVRAGASLSCERMRASTVRTTFCASPKLADWLPFAPM